MKKLEGAAALTHFLKEYGGKSMEAGIQRIALENRRVGYRQGYSDAIKSISQPKFLTKLVFKK